MKHMLGRLQRHLLAISPAETTLARRRFRLGNAAAQQRLEQIGSTFLYGYHAALRDDTPAALGEQLAHIEPECCGFAFEGAGMALALLDQLAPWRRQRLQAFLHGPGAAHPYIVHVGAGWSLAFLRRRVERPLARLDPLLRWLAVDGYGFYHGYFHWPRAITEQTVPQHLTGYARRAFDQGLGRSLWFVEGTDVTWIPETIAAFPPARQADLWSGVGLACAYAGGVEQTALATLGQAAGSYRTHLAQGVAFAARARQQAGNPAEHTALACAVLCGLSADAAAAVVAVTAQALPPDGAIPAYEVWRQRIRAHYTPAFTLNETVQMT